MKKLTKKEAEGIILKEGSYNGITRKFLSDLETLRVGEYALCEQEEYGFKTDLSSMARNASIKGRFFDERGMAFKAVKIRREGKGKVWIFTRIK